MRKRRDENRDEGKCVRGELEVKNETEWWEVIGLEVVECKFSDADVRAEAGPRDWAI